MKSVRVGLLLLVFAVTLQVVWYAVLMISYIRMPGKLEQADFLFYYSVGRVAREHGLDTVYNLDLESTAQAEVTNLPVGAQDIFLPNHPPFLYPVLMFISYLDYRSAYTCFAVFLYLLVIAGLPSLGRALKQNGWSRLQVWLALGGILLFEPFFISVLKGQDSALLLLGGILWLSGMIHNDDRLAGLGLSLTFIRPQIAIMLALPFLFRRRKIFDWFCAGAAALGLYSYLQVGWNGMSDYINILTLSAGGEGYGMSESSMFNFSGLLLRLAPRLDLDLVHSIGWILFGATLVGMCLLWVRSKSIRYHHIALVVVMSLFAAPHLHYHDLALLVIPVIGLGLAGIKAGRMTIVRAAVLPMSVSVLLLFSEFWDPVRFTTPYLLMAVLPSLTWWYETR